MNSIQSAASKSEPNSEPKSELEPEPEQTTLKLFSWTTRQLIVEHLICRFNQPNCTDPIDPIEPIDPKTNAKTLETLLKELSRMKFMFVKRFQKAATKPVQAISAKPTTPNNNVHISRRMKRMLHVEERRKQYVHTDTLESVLVGLMRAKKLPTKLSLYLDDTPESLHCAFGGMDPRLILPNTIKVPRNFFSENRQSICPFTTRQYTADEAIVQFCDIEGNIVHQCQELPQIINEENTNHCRRFWTVYNSIDRDTQNGSCVCVFIDMKTKISDKEHHKRMEVFHLNNRSQKASVLFMPEKHQTKIIVLDDKRTDLYFDVNFGDWNQVVGAYSNAVALASKFKTKVMFVNTQWKYGIVVSFQYSPSIIFATETSGIAVVNGKAVLFEIRGKRVVFISAPVANSDYKECVHVQSQMEGFVTFRNLCVHIPSKTFLKCSTHSVLYVENALEPGVWNDPNRVGSSNGVADGDDLSNNTESAPALQYAFDFNRNVARTAHICFQRLRTYYEKWDRFVKFEPFFGNGQVQKVQIIPLSRFKRKR